MATHPVRLEASIDPNLTRWMWLVKWLLAIPHYFVLIFLQIGAVIVWIIAFISVLITGTYPRPLFDYTVGVMRWNWRVNAYVTLLSTDRYPPFKLGSDPDYPADLDVAYPERLSRGLALVKWWLLAIPHYLLIAAFLGSWSSGDRHQMTERANEVPPAGLAVLGVLVLIAIVGLVFTGRYLPGIFDLRMGLHRWYIRVAVYAALLTDEYPPFRLDQGGREPIAEPAPAGATG
ncbi:DUF4389 domain-containing protein [Pseudonocardiaceae bacterium YIM PH 21723]|nr:DUF4389 domain-containing protein [Pseudonocardiaceae bacterium YIM PH 21723]